MGMWQIGGPGINLPVPAQAFMNSPVGGTNRIHLGAGEMFLVPPGSWNIWLGSYSFCQFKDPVTGMWLSAWGSGELVQVNSDGTNYRVANLTGTPVGAVITNVGSGYVAATTLVVPSAGGSTWVPIIGGTLGSFTIGGSGGSGFTLPPIVLISAPGAGGLPATASATLTSGAVSAITLKSAGAGYLSPPTVTLVPDPRDPGLGSIVIPSVTVALTGAGTLTGLLCTYPGTVQTAVPTLTISGAGASAAATVVMCWSITAVTVGNTGATVIGTAVSVESIGGGMGVAPAIVQGEVSTGYFRVRRANISAPVSGGAVGTPVLQDSGLFQAAPTPVIVQASGAVPGTAPAATFTMGGVDDVCSIQSLG